jgi:hypothetical protein
VLQLLLGEAFWCLGEGLVLLSLLLLLLLLGLRARFLRFLR